MRRALTKGKAFWAGLASLLALSGLAAWRAPDSLESIIPGMALAIVGLVGAFAGFNVADKVATGKYYRPEMEGK
jgi:hypothetical protein